MLNKSFIYIRVLVILHHCGKMISKLIQLIGVVLFSTRKEQIAVSNFFNNKVKRDIRNNYNYKREYWLVVK